jgi:ABC-type glycerol-3-phosphate transport system permease component
VKNHSLTTKTNQLVIIPILVFIAFLVLVPLLLAINTAFKPPEEEWIVLSLPSKIYLNNFVFSFLKVVKSLWNSVLITIPSMILSTLVGAMAAYPLSQIKFKGDTFVYMLLLAGLYIPYTSVLIPLFFIIKKIGLYDTIPGLWLTHIAFGVPYTTFILRNFFATVPEELMEASVIDGCGMVKYFWKILLPVARTGIAATLILQFSGIWNEFMFALTLTRSPSKFPITVALQSFGSRTDIQWGPLMAATLISIIPTIIILIVFKKQFVSGLTGVFK